MSKTRKTISIIILSAVLTGGVYAYVKFMPRTLVVPDKFKTIGEAVQKARPGDTVFVKEGQYNESVDLKTGIRLKGQAKDKVKIKCDTAQKSILNAKDCNNVRISDLTLEDGSVHMLRKSYAALQIMHSSVEVTNCDIRGAAGPGVEGAHNSTVIIKNCLIEKNGDEGINTRGEGILNLQGVRTKDRSGMLLAENCEIKDNANNGIRASGGTKAEIKKCRIKLNGKSGITIFNGLTEASVSDNNIEKNKSEGIYIGSWAKADIENNRCLDNGETGILVVKNSKAIVKNNICKGNGKAGIQFYTDSQGNVEKNICSANLQKGIIVYMVKGPLTVMANQCIDNNECGLGIANSSEITAKDNTFERNSQNGVTVWDSNNIQLTGNKSEKNDQYGILITLSSDCQLKENICNGNFWPGIYANKNKGFIGITANTCNENNFSGIMLDYAGNGKAAANVCSNNTWCGISVKDASSKYELSGNKCVNNGAWGIACWGGASPAISKDNVLTDNWKGNLVQHD